jgi:hypothetical protein
VGADPDKEVLGRPIHGNFWGDGNIGQCNGAAYGIQSAWVGQWTNTVLIDADSRSGGCYLQFAIVDPDSTLVGLQVNVDFESDGGNADQCNYAGLRSIPIDSSSPTWSTAYRIDTDSRDGGCLQTFSLSGRSDVVLDINFTTNGDG